MRVVLTIDALQEMCSTVAVAFTIIVVVAFAATKTIPRLLL